MEKEEKLKHDSSNKSTKSTKSTRPNKNSTEDNKKGGKKQGLNCLVHGENCGHTSDQCFVLKKQAKKLKKSTGNTTSNNDYADLHTMIAKAVKTAVKPLRKKRKMNPDKDLQAFEEPSISDDEASTSSYVSEDSE